LVQFLIERLIEYLMIYTDSMDFKEIGACRHRLLLIRRAVRQTSAGVLSSGGQLSGERARRSDHGLLYSTGFIVGDFDCHVWPDCDPGRRERGSLSEVAGLSCTSALIAFLVSRWSKGVRIGGRFREMSAKLRRATDRAHRLL
jgi:hypothetical protein